MLHDVKRRAAILTDAGKNFIRYGRNAPVPLEPLFVNPQNVKFVFKSNRDMDDSLRLGRASGVVRDGDWDKNQMPRHKKWKFCAVVAHFRDGKSWEETGIIDRTMKLIDEHGEFDKLRTLEDVIARYESLDRVYDQVCAAGTLQTRRELGLTWWSERGGIYGHVGSDGEFLRFRNGNHRFAIAVCAGLTEIPVRVGVVHPDAVKAGVIRRMRKRVADQ